MANEFAITAAANTVALSDERTGTATFTVFNASGRDLLGRATLETVPAGGEHMGWLSIDGQRDRGFAIAGTDQFTVQIVAPAEAAPGSYTFQLNMVDTHNPDEGFNAGPTITFTVPEPKEEPKERPPWLIPLIIGIVALILITVIVIIVLNRGPKAVAVPDVIGMTLADAQDAIEDAGLRQRQGANELSNTVAAGLVARTDPQAGVEVESDSRVDIFVSDGGAPTSTPTPTPTVTPTPTATPIPVISADGLTYQVVRNGRVSILLQNASGDPIPLISRASDAQVLDYTPHDGGLYLIWVLQGSAESVALVRADGTPLERNINHGWNAVVDAYWSPDGARFVIETSEASDDLSKIVLYFFDNRGELLGQQTP